MAITACGALEKKTTTDPKKWKKQTQLTITMKITCQLTLDYGGHKKALKKKDMTTQ